MVNIKFSRLLKKEKNEIYFQTGFEGVIDRFRISEKQKDWYLSNISLIFK
jgi:hypothetical protein